MVIFDSTVTLKNGTTLTLRSPLPPDAAQLNAYLRQTSGETHFMVRDPEECNQTLEAAQSRLQAMLDDERSFMLAAFLDGELVGNCAITALSPRRKLRHRAEFGISIKKKAWGLGLGTILLTRALAQAKENGFTQVELGVFEDNIRARSLYAKLGFAEMGRIPKAFLLKDGTYRDEIQMVCFL